jgi:hypothetical protein
MKDWKGNVIKEGDEICLIKTKQIDYFGRMLMLMPEGDGKFTEVVVKEKPDEPKEVWEVGEYATVFLKDGRLCVTTDYGEFKVTQGIDELLIFRTDEIVLGIKGVSDTKE